ncbi:hypothetical protein COT62_02900 [Candidatus Roizmanbacteria bacterium CG09_land_8_20_14_0_10_41_9]|uniref:Uncharacterized protein n=1 Tax=Candidatus Roizmanbacteria bacterium CG09_land_8_20_14_0_10_41_9 TaxID=1974850 RepID=A0A2H0WSD0_9BACT|nr:MAG: hypothetical protein COT62_02900 [Candidatus Roizmanbacteria bacterium CG09_land_8_20_14_0_10_41_9]
MLSVLKKGTNFLKKAFLVIATYVVVINLFFFFSGKNRQTASVDYTKRNREEIYKTLKDPKLNSTKEGKLTVLFYRATMCGLIGEACTDNPIDADKNYSRSIFGFMTNLIVLPYSNPPASGIYWAYSGLQNSGFIPKTLAAEGIGFAGLAPFQNLWLIFRNFVFMIMVLIIIAIGFMIMFRTKINPQTVISLENSLPRIVIAMILITFSYAIAGFLIDLMYVVSGFVIILMSSNTQVPLDSNTLFNQYLLDNKRAWWSFFTIGNPTIVWTAATSIADLMPITIRNILSGVTYYIVARLVLTIPVFKDVMSAQVWGDIDIAGFAFGPIGLVISLIIYTIFSALTFGLALKVVLTILFIFSIVFILFRIFFMLLSTYLNTLFLIIFSPVILSLEMIPGKSSFSSWLKNLILNLFTFPLVITLTLIAKIIVNMPPDQTGKLWAPPLLLSIDPEAFKLLIGVGIFFSIPNLVKTFKQLLGVKPLPVDIGIGSLFTGGQAAMGGTMGLLQTFSSINLGLGALGIANPLIKKAQGKPGEDINKQLLEAIKGLKQGPG